MPRAANKFRAFTLVEILCVVVILGICSAVIIPQLSSRDDLRVAAAARVVVADVMYAQSRAISSQQKHFLEFSGQSYTMKTRTSDAASMVIVTHPVTKENYLTGFSTASSSRGLESCTLVGWSFGNGINVLGFDELGAPFAYSALTNTMTSLTSPATIQVRSGNQTITISIEPFTGEATIN
jgi:prepilin-type N-terminal cleavage/methylation domain-containing protein